MKETLKPGYKHTALGWIPEDWEVEKISNVVSVIVGRDLRELNFNATKTEHFQFPVYSNTVDNEGLYGYYNIEEYSGKALTIVGRGAGLGTAFYRDGISFGAIGRLLVLFPNDVADAKFLTEYVNGKLQLFREDGGIPQLTGQEIGKYIIPLPPLPEQRKIAAILASWDKAIATQNALIALLETRHRALMQKLLGGKVRLKGFAGEWKEVRLGDVAIVTMGQSPNSSAYNSVGNGLPLLQGNADIKDRKTITRFWTTEITKECFAGDIVMSVRAPVGTIGVATTNSCIGRGICAIKSRPENSQNFLYFFMVNFEEKWKEFEQGSTFTAVNSNDVKSLSFSLPADLEEQRAIAQILTTSESEIAGHRRQLAALKEQKKGLMQVLLSGKKRVTI